MNPVRKTCAVGMIVSLASLTACKTTEDADFGVKEQAAAIGVVAGGLLGAVIGGNDGRLLGVAIGAAAGGALGYALGSSLESRKADYASDEAFYDAQISESRDLNEQLAKSNAALKKDVVRLKSETKALLASYKKNKTDKSKLVAQKATLDENAEHINSRLADLEKEAKVQNEVVADAKKTGDEARSEALASEVKTLEAEIAQLRGMAGSVGEQSAAIGQYL